MGVWKWSWIWEAFFHMEHLAVFIGGEEVGLGEGEVIKIQTREQGLGEAGGIGFEATQ